MKKGQYAIKWRWMLGMIAAAAALSGAAQGVDVQFSKPAGVYTTEVRVALWSKVAGAAIYYTTDGSRPTRNGQRYVAPLVIGRTTVVRAVAFGSLGVSAVETRTFLVGEFSDYMTVSVAVQPEVLFDSKRGWFVAKSDSVSLMPPYKGANFWSEQEVAAHVELFEPEGEVVFADDVGLRLFGGLSRAFAQKSLTFATRRAYSAERVGYKLFAQKPHLKEFKHLVLRSGGSDFGKGHFRDVLMVSLTEGMDIESQAYRPVIVFINGAYWGLYFLREKVNEHFIEANCGVDKDSLDLIEHQKTVKCGSLHHYSQMLDYMEKHDLNKDKHFAYIGSQMDVENFMNLQIAQIYFDNRDAGGNIKFWRPQRADGRWRWVLFDTDWGFGMQTPDAYRFNSLAFHTAENEKGWPNPAWSTFILRQLLKNESFQIAFVNRFCDDLNTRFSADSAVARVDSFEKLLAPEMPRHLHRWQLSAARWQEHVERMKVFAKERPNYMRAHLGAYFGLSDLVEIAVSSTAGGSVWVNKPIKVTSERLFSGKYFRGVPINLRAVAQSGYRFSHWEGLSSNKSEVEVLPENLKKVRAVFVRFKHPLQSQMVINEVSPADKKAGDWVELYNLTANSVNLAGWVLRDAQHEFVMPFGVVSAQGYLVVCTDTNAFRQAYPEAINIVGNLPFGFNKERETLQLFAPSGALVDSIGYVVSPLDSAFTLCLRAPHLDNGLGQNWEVVVGNSSPNAPNPSWLQLQVHAETQRKFLWMYGIGSLLVLLVLLVSIRLFGRGMKRRYW